MSLDVDWSSIDKERYPDREDEFGDTQLNAVTFSLAFASMAVGISKITEKNAGEFYTRLAMIERLHGAGLSNKDGPRFITPAEIHDHIGLRTNASTLSSAAFAKTIYKREHAELLNRFKADMEVVALAEAAGG